MLRGRSGSCGSSGGRASLSCTEVNGCCIVASNPKHV
jgi:hypothetical protein